MKKKVYLFILCISLLLLSGCNRDMFDTIYSYDYAYIEMPNGTCIEGKVDSWRDYEDGDQLQITIEGDTYLTDSTRAVLIKYSN